MNRGARAEPERQGAPRGEAQTPSDQGALDELARLDGPQTHAPVTDPDVLRLPCELPHLVHYDLLEAVRSVVAVLLGFSTPELLPASRRSGTG